MFDQSWQSTTLGELADISSGESLPVFLRSGPYQLMGANGRIGQASQYNFEGGLLVGRVGAAGEVTQIMEPCWVSDNALMVRPRHNRLSILFAYYLLESIGLNALATKTAQPLVTQSQLNGLRLFLPKSLHEQTLIARILDTLDTQIHKTEALIAKLEKVKEGLLRDLLTRGIDENGQLRPSPDQAPELYKDSPLGLIPKEWESQLLGDAANILHGYAFKGEHFSDKPEGKRLLTPGNFHRDGGLYFEAGNSKWFSGKIPPGYVLLGNDAVTVMTDLSPKALILGRAVVLEEGEELLHNQRIGKIILQDPTSNCMDFLALIINSHRFRRQVIAEATGTTVRHTSPDRMISVKVVLPSKEEQLRITRVYQANEDSIVSEKISLQKQTLEKRSLKEDLLTGRVRVTPLLDQAQTPA